MPELPEVETMRRGVLPVVGSQIVSVERPRCRLRPISILPSLAVLRKRAVGRTIVDVDRVGKRVVLVLDSGDRLVLEPRMTGLVLLADPPNRTHLRLRLGLTGGDVPELLFWDRRGLGSVRLWSADEFAAEYFGGKLGPDALAIKPADLQSRLASSQRAIKVALLDQKALAGVGNLYASELLHVARVHPALRCDQLSTAEWVRVHRAMIRVLSAAIRHEGSTLSDGTYRNALNRKGRYQNRHRVYARGGKPCRTCRVTTVVRIVQAQRATFFCPACQAH